MKTMLKLFLVGAASVVGAGTAQAQAGGAPVAPAPPPNAGLQGENSAVRNGGDTFDRDAAMARDEAIAKQRQQGSAKAPRAVPAKPEEIVAGSEVRDSKGVAIGTIESVSIAAAVLNYGTGKVEVPLEAFGKDKKGLLIGMTKAEFDKAVAAATKPAG